MTPVFSSKLPNGLTYNVHEMVGFAGHAEIAIEINGKAVSIVSIDEGRIGYAVKTVQTNKLSIPFEAKPTQPAPDAPDESPSTPQAPTLSDIAG